MIYLNNQTLKMGEEKGSSFAGAACGGNVVGVTVFPVQVGGVIKGTGEAVEATLGWRGVAVPP